MGVDDAVKWGFLSTANINDKLLPGAEASPDVDVVAVASRDAAARRPTRGREGSSGRTAATRSCSQTRRSKSSTSRCRTPCTSSGRSARSRRASTSSARSRSAAIRRTSSGPSTPPRRPAAFSWRRSCTGTTRRRSASGARRGRRDREAPAGPRGVQLPARRRGQRAPERTSSKAAGSWTSAATASRARGSSPASLSRSTASRSPRPPAWTSSSRERCASPATSSREIDCGLVLPERDELEAIGEEGSIFLDDPWHCRKPVIEVRREDGTERIELEPEDSYRLQLENMSAAIRGRAEPLLGREDALGQARAIEALYRSADEGRPVSLAS